MFFNLIQILICCITFAACQGWAIDDEGCRTPDRGVGTCILARNCKMMVAFLKSAPRPLSFHIKSKLKKYICGNERGSPKVCCPTKSIPLAFSELKMQSESDLIKNHKNLNLLPTECGYAGILDKISNGHNAALGEFPWMALLSYKTSNGSKFFCGGTVINDKYILTAAHCLTILKDKFPLNSVRVGEYDLSTEMDCKKLNSGKMKCADPVQDLIIEKVIPHPKFTTDHSGADGFNDIGLLRVKNMKPAGNVVPICLPFGEAVNPNLEDVIITGWGFVKEKKRSDILQKVTIPVISQNECQEAYGTVHISNKQLCANGVHKDTCDGDSGGPLQFPKFFNEEARMVQYGVTSSGGKTCGSGSHPGLYTRVESYMHWILDNIQP